MQTSATSVLGSITTGKIPSSQQCRPGHTILQRAAGFTQLRSVTSSRAGEEVLWRHSDAVTSGVSGGGHHVDDLITQKEFR